MYKRSKGKVLYIISFHLHEIQKQAKLSQNQELSQGTGQEFYDQEHRQSEFLLFLQ